MMTNMNQFNLPDFSAMINSSGQAGSGSTGHTGEHGGAIMDPPSGITMPQQQDTFFTQLMTMINTMLAGLGGGGGGGDGGGHSGH